ncbi:2-amino-4-hydroxy-6-hydroxymethyldihydropteridine diphosphokinase [Pseudorhodobacter turbinis]|uniref:2-amino-4-hydroxy-6- hydroxymethyldihydropteridine diphosphokinase n=1 Tax=Pseudorhodobacter turbinis TaxID=2500533 RepID=UPI001F103369|nr:2-amino-4-hydroxy-6-hydroxymethyldihydropteridine diphosphokinase [Pseudorhodobacter turbinis]
MNGLRILVALGANLPSDQGGVARVPADSLRAAIADLGTRGLQAVSQSRFFATPCFPAGAGPDYVNAAAVFDVPPGQTPQEILALLHEVEAAHGRTRETRWAGRVLDLDLLAVGDQVLPNLATYGRWRGLALTDQLRLAPDQLVLPHPRMAERAFVLVPLADIAPDWRHPVSGKTVREMHDALPTADLAAVRPLPNGR